MGEDVSNVSHSDAQQVIKDICKSNFNKLIFGQRNINSLRRKFDIVSELIKNKKILLIFSWYLKQNSMKVFLMVTMHFSVMTEMAMAVAFFFTSARTYQQKSSTCDFPSSESFFVDINLHKKKWLINFPITHTRTISAAIWMLLPKH